MTEGSVAKFEAEQDFWWLFNVLSAVLSTLAIVALARRAFEGGNLSAPLALVIGSYNWTIHLLLGWAEPYLEAVLKWLGQFIGWRPQLYPHWRDMFVLLSLWMAGPSRASRTWFYPQSATIVVLIGLIVAIVWAVGLGTLPLQSDNIGAQVLVSSSLGLTMMFLAPAWGRPMAGVISGGALAALLALITIVLALVFDHPARLGIIVLVAAVFCYASLLLFLGLIFRRADPERSRLVVQWGLTILGGFIGAAVFFAIDAGLKLLGG